VRFGAQLRYRENKPEPLPAEEDPEQRDGQVAVDDGHAETENDQMKEQPGPSEVKQQSQCPQTQFMALDKPVAARPTQYLDVFRVRGRPLELSENQYKVAGDADSNSPASLVSLIYQNQAEAEQQTSSTASGSTQLALYHNPYWVRSLQLAQPLMPFASRPYYDMPNRFKTCDEQIGTEVEQQFSEKLHLAFDGELFAQERQRHALMVSLQRHDGINE